MENITEYLGNRCAFCMVKLAEKYYCVCGLYYCGGCRYDKYICHIDKDKILFCYFCDKYIA